MTTVRTQPLGILLGIFLSVLLLNSCNNKTKPTGKTIVNINDTSFVKTIKWDRLNNFVDYHIVQIGKRKTDTNLHFSVRPIAFYHYLNKSFEQLKNVTALNISPRELKELILSDSFTNKQDFNCLLKINSHIEFQYRPDLLQTVIVRPKNMSNDGIKSLITRLKSQAFVQAVTNEAVKPNGVDTLFHVKTKTVFINIKLKQNYWNLEKIKNICAQLKQRTDINDAFFPDFFTGVNEVEMIYRLTTEKNSR